MTGDPGHRLDSSNLLAGLMEQIRREMVPELAELARQAVREELARGAAAAEWLTQPQAAALAGVRPQTVRAWQASGKLSKGRRGRVNAEELRRFLASSGRPTPAAGPLDLGRERARRAAAEILRGKGAR